MTGFLRSGQPSQFPKLRRSKEPRMTARRISEKERWERFWKRVDIQLSRCWEWLGGVGSAGYGFVSLGNGKNAGAHRFMWKLVNGDIPPESCVLHRCDNRRCVNPAHLFLGNKGDNARDCAEKFRTSKGKLSPEDVRKIRSDQRSIRTIASEYGVNSSCISRVKNRQLYGHLA